MKILLLPLLLGFSVPAIAHNEFNGGSEGHPPVGNTGYVVNGCGEEERCGGDTDGKAAELRAKELKEGK